MNYVIEPELPPTEFIDVLRRSTLAERRPVDDSARIAKMLAGADLVVTARDADGTLVGVSRAITDFAYCTYLSDLAVDVAHQGHGIGRKLIHVTHEHAGLETRLILLAAPAAASYYPHIEMEQHDSCWMIPPQ
ncbi:GNAT family N-acetyltransferase [Novipirellula artificiosorum]|nr:GNAT family N-acetyltransferase [Novipirellula artificiosorum]